MWEKWTCVKRVWGGARIDNFGKMEEWCERRGNDRKIGGFSEIEE